MKKTVSLLAFLLLAIAVTAQTLNVKVGNVTYLFPSTDTGDMVFSGGTTLTVMGKEFTLADISGINVDDTEVTAGNVAVVYNGTSASATVAGDIASMWTLPSAEPM